MTNFGGRVLITCLLAGMSTGKLDAQSLTAGLRLGGVRGQLHGDPHSRPDSRFGFAAGAAVELELGRILAISAELHYTQQGARDQSGWDLRLGYLQAPVLVSARIPRAIAGLTPVLRTGIAPAEELGCRLLYEPDRPDLARNDASAVPIEGSCGSERTERWDVQLVLAAGVIRSIERTRLSIEVRYLHGTNDLSRGYSCCSTFNRDIVLLAGFSVEVLPIAR